MRIVLTNVHPDDNRGSCALTWAALDTLWAAFPHARIAILPITTVRTRATTTIQPDPFRHTKRRYEQIEILDSLLSGRGRSSIFALAWRVAEIGMANPVRPLKHPTLEWIRNSDLVASRGGVIFHTLPQTLRGHLSLLIRSLGALAAHRLNVPVALLGMQAGPFGTNAGHFLFRRIVQQNSLVFPRDEVSRATVASVAGPSNVHMMPDSVFGLTLPGVDVSDVFHRRGLRPDLPTLAIALSSELQEAPHAHAIRFARLAAELRKAGLIDQVLIVVQAEHDRDVSVLLASLLGAGSEIVVDEDLDPAQLVALYAACKLVVSSRLHAVLLSFLGGTPAISVATGISFKEAAVLDAVGLGDLCLPPDHQHEDLLGLCTRVCELHAAFIERIASAVGSARATLSAIPGLLRKLPGSGRRQGGGEPRKSQS